MVKLTSAIIFAVGSLVGFTQARYCQNVTVPVTISARNGVFSVKAPVDLIDVNNFVLNVGRQGHNYTQEVLTGYATVAGTYKIAGTLCLPDKGANTVQLLTHGIGFERSYWDLSYNNYQYGYAAYANANGFATFAWDRLGVGLSQRGEPVNEIQSFLEVAALGALTQILRAGTIPGCIQKFAKVVHVGHSFGSVVTYGMLNQYPALSDGAVLTGFGLNPSFIPLFVYSADLVPANTIPALASYGNGSITIGSASAIQKFFFAPGQFDPDVLQYAFKIGQPLGIGEFLTIGGIPIMNKFSGPVQVITGSRDIPFCGGDCLATGDPALSSIPAGVKMAFPSARVFQTDIVLNAGHGLNLEFSYAQTYQSINKFIVAQVGY